MTTPPELSVGLRPPFEVYASDIAVLRHVVARAEAAGIDHLSGGDHVSFRGGQGFDGFVQATALAALSTRLSVFLSLYLLPLRHPVPVARQVVSLAQLAGNRLVFGVGLGGDDRHEMEICDVDPSTRGRRFDSSLDVVRRLLAGESVTVDDEFFSISEAQVLPTPPARVPIVVGGRSSAALRRTGHFGDGWLGIFVSPNRFSAAVDEVAAAAEARHREDVAWHHGMHVWCAFGETADAERRLAAALEGFYKLPFETFRRYAPAGSPAEIAEAVAPYLEAGCRYLNLMPATATVEEAVDGVAEVRELLRAGRRIDPRGATADEHV